MHLWQSITMHKLIKTYDLLLQDLLEGTLAFHLLSSFGGWKTRVDYAVRN